MLFAMLFAASAIAKAASLSGTEAPTEPEKTITVTYKLYDYSSGNYIDSETKSQEDNSKVDIPASLKKYNWYDYDTDKATVTANIGGGRLPSR